MKSLKVRIFPTRQQEIVIRTLSNEHRVLCNHYLNAATNIAKRHMGNRFAQTENFADFLQGFQKMYVRAKNI